MSQTIYGTHGEQLIERMRAMVADSEAGMAAGTLGKRYRKENVAGLRRSIASYEVLFAEWKERMIRSER